MFWSELSQPARIMRSDLDGSNPEPFVTSLSQPGSLVIDAVSRNLYFVDTLHNSIHFVDLTGKQSVEVKALVPCSLKI